jgi:hypothetical protein
MSDHADAQHGSSSAGRTWRLANEFAHVELTLSHSALGPRVVIRNLGRGAERAFDPFILGVLAEVDIEQLLQLADPQYLTQEQDL